MKLIKKVLLWLALGVAVLYGLAGLVDGDFARYVGYQVLAVFGAIGLISGFRAALRARKERKKITQAVQEVDNARQQRTDWANEAKRRAVDVASACNKNNQIESTNLLFTPEYEAEESLEEITTSLTMLSRVRGRAMAAVQKLEEEDGL